MRNRWLGYALVLALLVVIFGSRMGRTPRAIEAASTAGPSTPVDWQAKWIWPATTAVPAHPNQFVQFRKNFTLKNVPQHARLAVFADSRYQIYVNGMLVGRGPARAPAFWGYYDVFDVARLLKPGKNVIAAEVRWLDAPMGWYRPQAGAPDHGGLVCQLEAGESTIVTDATWKSREDASMRWGQPHINGALPEIEVTDGALAEDHWKEIDYDDGSWTPAQVIQAQSGQTGPPEEPYAHMEERPMATPFELDIDPQKVVDAGETERGPASSAAADNATGASIPKTAADDLSSLGHFIATEPHRSDRAILKPSANGMVAINAIPGGRTSYVIYDMGKEVDGYPTLALDAPAGTLVELAWSEVLDEGHVAADRSGGNYVARYFARQGTQQWNLWGWHGLRYLEVRFTGSAAPVRFHLGLTSSAATLDRAGSFESSDPLLNQLWEMGAYTFQLCTFDGTMDCPTREQREWVGDGEVELAVNDAVNHNPEVDRKFLLDVARDQRQDGAIPSVAASGQSEDWVIDDYMFSFVNAAHEYYLQTGDGRFIESIYPEIQRTLRWFDAFRQSDGMLNQMPYWVFLGWSNPYKDGESSILNALYVHALENGAELAEVAGDPRSAQRFRAQARQIRAGFNAKFWMPARGLYADTWKNGHPSDYSSQIANADAVLFGFAQPAAVDSILQKITDPANLVQQQFDAKTGDMNMQQKYDPKRFIKQAQTYGSNFVLQALVAHGHEGAALELIRKGWGPMAAEGNGTFWEHFTENAGTSCHAWSASPTYILSRSVLGVSATAPGYAAYRVAPQVADLTWAKGVVPTPQGVVAVDWRLQRGAGGSKEFVLNLSIPADAKVEVALPSLAGHSPARVRLNGQRHDGAVELLRRGTYKIEATY